MKNFIQAGANIGVTAAADLKSGDLVKINALIGVAQGDAASGERVTLVREGVFLLPKTTGQAWSQGAKIYWNDTAKECTTTASGNTLVGCVAEDAASADAVGKVLLDGVVR